MRGFYARATARLCALARVLAHPALLRVCTRVPARRRALFASVRQEISARLRALLHAYMRLSALLRSFWHHASVHLVCFCGLPLRACMRASVRPHVSVRLCALPCVSKRFCARFVCLCAPASAQTCAFRRALLRAFAALCAPRMSVHACTHHFCSAPARLSTPLLAHLCAPLRFAFCTPVCFCAFAHMRTWRLGVLTRLCALLRASARFCTPLCGCTRLNAPLRACARFGASRCVCAQLRALVRACARLPLWMSA